MGPGREALAGGDLTDSLAALLENASRALETTELARRIFELESRVADEGSRAPGR